MIELEDRTLSIAKCRAILKGEQLKEEEVVSIRDAMYQFVEVFVKMYITNITANNGQ